MTKNGNLLYDICACPLRFKSSINMVANVYTKNLEARLTVGESSQQGEVDALTFLVLKTNGLYEMTMTLISHRKNME